MAIIPGAENPPACSAYRSAPSVRHSRSSIFATASHTSMSRRSASPNSSYTTAKVCSTTTAPSATPAAPFCKPGWTATSPGSKPTRTRNDRCLSLKYRTREMTNTAESPEDVPRLFVENWNDRRADLLAELFEEDADFINVVGLWWENRE